MWNKDWAILADDCWQTRTTVAWGEASIILRENSFGVANRGNRVKIAPTLDRTVFWRKPRVNNGFRYFRRL